ncbi:hypothetical protein CHRY9390_01302 [Chryseobacterium aquaeductus]|uniref:Secretion system C-terminal sorting domain-containing protein n=1 Tax=Chryseobacterium aquaeductus TaxID=2675056 RepID=A0A9N8MF34_9FLAO|nr:T9SS type A sorting domain-containing protein [Chryseobacterium aquaeductus]CAA7330631.1 hypothetical protein CHRY9390_01302 [Chryseobacterium potabilaquae]CAD7804986.1 hypothetical protein CHRY9390_01302 [Chryseobacterium aquaeductus]
MKCKFLILFCLGFLSHLNSQILQQENFDALNAGSIVAQLGMGVEPYQIDNGANGDYVVEASGSGKNLKILCDATNDTSRRLWKDGLDNAWATRTAGNNIIQIEYDYFTGPVSTSNNAGGIELYNDTSEFLLGGLSMQHSNKTLSGIYTTTTGTIGFTDLGTGIPAASVVLPANSWVRLGFAYNTLNGTVTYKGPGFYKTITGTAVKVPFQFNYVAQDILGTNNASSEHLFDNVIVKAVAAETLLLSTNESTPSADYDISIYPSPATDFINVKSKYKITNIYIYDMSGIRMDAEMNNNKVNVQNLKPGIYLIGLKTDKGLITRKFSKR